VFRPFLNAVRSSAAALDPVPPESRRQNRVDEVAECILGIAQGTHYIEFGTSLRIGSAVVNPTRSIFPRFASTAFNAVFAAVGSRMTRPRPKYRRLAVTTSRNQNLWRNISDNRFQILGS